MNEYSFIIKLTLDEFWAGGGMARTGAQKIVDKRAAIIDAAVSLFASQGFHGTAVPDIAERAGVAAGTIYRYFETKEALVNALVAERKQAMLDAFVAAIGAGGGLETRFRRAWRQMVAFAIAHPDDFRFFELHHHETYIGDACRAVGDRLMAAAVGFVSEIVRAHGRTTPGPEVLVSLVWGGLVGLLKSADQRYLTLDAQMVDAAGLVLWHAITGTAAPSATIFPEPIERLSP